MPSTPPQITANVASHLPRMAAEQAETLALAVPRKRRPSAVDDYRQLTFRDLNSESDRLAYALESVGIRRETRTVVMVPPGVEFFALTFALFKLGAPPVMIDPGMGIANLKPCLDEAKPEAFIGSRKAQLARATLGWARGSVRVSLTAGRQLAALRSQAPEKPYPMAEPEPAQVAAILFTSGSTGPAKGVVYTHENFTAQVEALRSMYDIRPGEVDVPTFPLFALFAPALGMSSILPAMDFTRPGCVDPRAVIAPVQLFRATNMFGSPALLRRVGEWGAARGVRLPSLRRVISAGAPVPAEVVETFSQMLTDDAQVYTPYGATEALPVASIGGREILSETRSATDEGAGVCVGRPAPGIEVEVIRISDEPIERWSEDLPAPAGEIGEFAVTGAVVTRRYWAREEATRLAKIDDPQRRGFHHRMGDVGYRDAKGRLWFCGRKAHRVTTENGVLFTVPCEAVFNTHPRVHRTALVGVGPPGRQRPILCVELRQRGDARGRQRIKAELLEIARRHEHTRLIETILFHPDFPVDVRHNAKIFRERLAEWAARELS